MSKVGWVINDDGRLISDVLEITNSLDLEGF